MSDEIESLVVGVRADVSGFSRDVSDMRGALEGPLATGAANAGRLVESSLLRAVQSGKLGFDDLGKVAVAALGQIAATAVKAGLDSIGGVAGGSSGSGLLSVANSLFNSYALGLPGRATGGPVSPGRAFMVGENGSELFVPTASGSIAPLSSTGGGGRDVRVAIQVNAPPGDNGRLLARSARQVAQAVRSALAG